MNLMYPTLTTLQAPLTHIGPPIIRDLADERSRYQIADAGAPISGQRLRNDTDFMTYQRVSFPRLANAYSLDPLAQTAVNLYASIIKDAGATVFSDVPEVQRGIDEFLSPIRERFERVFFELAPMHLGIYGNAWIENMVGRRTGAVRSFTIANPQRMDFIRIDNTFRAGPVALQNGEEAGFVQWNDEIAADQIFFTRQQMTHLRLNQVHIGELGFGPIEGMFSDIQLKQSMEEALTASAFLAAFRRPVFEFGDTTSKFIGYHPSSRLQREMKNVAADVVDKGSDYMVLPPHLHPSKSMPYIEPGKLDPTHMDYLNFQAKQLAGVARIPLAFLLQSGDTSAKDLDILLDMFFSAVRSFQRSLQIGPIMRNALDTNGLSTEGLKVRSGAISERAFKDANLGFLRGIKGLVQTASEDVIGAFGTPDIDITSSEFKQRLELALELGRDKNIIG